MVQICNGTLYLVADGVGDVVGTGNAGDDGNIVARANFAVRAHITHKFHSSLPSLLAFLGPVTAAAHAVQVVDMHVLAFLMSLVAMPISSPYLLISSPFLMSRTAILWP